MWHGILDYENLMFLDQNYSVLLVDDFCKYYFGARYNDSTLYGPGVTSSFIQVLVHDYMGKPSTVFT